MDVLSIHLYSVLHAEMKGGLGFESGYSLSNNSFHKGISGIQTILLLLLLLLLLLPLRLLFMAEILHHLACKKPVNNGINYLSTGAGVFQ